MRRPPPPRPRQRRRRNLGYSRFAACALAFAAAGWCSLAGGVARGGTVLIGDESRGVQFNFTGPGFGARNTNTTQAPFNVMLDETDTGEGGSARVRATYDSALSPALSRASGELLVDRAGRPAAANAAFILEFVVADDPAEMVLVLDAAYRRTAGDAHPNAATGMLRVFRRIPGAPQGVIGELFVDHRFAMGAGGDETETFRRGGDAGGADGAVQLEPGPYGLEFHIGLPEGPPDFDDWDLDGASLARSDGITFDLQARFVTTSGPPVIPLPPAAFTGGAALAALAGYRPLGARWRSRRRGVR